MTLTQNVDLTTGRQTSTTGLLYRTKGNRSSPTDPAREIRRKGRLKVSGQCQLRNIRSRTGVRDLEGKPSLGRFPFWESRHKVSRAEPFTPSPFYQNLIPLLGLTKCLDLTAEKSETPKSTSPRSENSHCERGLHVGVEGPTSE